jgi:hypothetical protein
MFDLRTFWNDETGFVISAELVAVGTVAVIGTTVGLKTLATAMTGELNDMARAVRSLDQSYSFQGFSSSRAWTAGSSFIQEPVAQSIADLGVGAPPSPGVVVTADGTPDKTVRIVPAEEKLSPVAPAPVEAPPAGSDRG